MEQHGAAWSSMEYGVPLATHFAEVQHVASSMEGVSMQ